MPKFLKGYEDNDVELCRTTSSRVGEQTARVLLKERIPFTKNCKKVPFFQRDKYEGADMVYVISTHPHSYGQARRALDGMDNSYKEALTLSNY